MSPPKANVSPEHAHQGLIGEVGKLRTLVANVGHYAALPFEEIEKVIAEIGSFAATIKKHV